MDFTLEDMEACEPASKGSIKTCTWRSSVRLRLLGREPIQSIALFGNSTF